MQLRTLLLVLALALTATFATVNWSAFVAPTTLSLVFTTIEAPLGLIMLAITAVIAVLFLAFIVYLQTSVLLEARRHAKALETQRQLADQAEASRFTELRAFLERELALLARLRVVVVLGTFAYEAAWRVLTALGRELPRPRPRFAHGLEVVTSGVTIVGCYHPSQQNTFTGRLTEPMLDAVLARARALATA